MSNNMIYDMHKDGEFIVRPGCCFLCGRYPEERVPLNANGTYAVPLCQNCLKKYNEGGKFVYIEHTMKFANINTRIDELEKKINGLETIIKKIVEVQKMNKHEDD